MVVMPQLGRDGEVGAEVRAAGEALAAAMGDAWHRRGPVSFSIFKGLSIDWVHGELGVMSFTWELPWRDLSGPARDDPRWKGLLHLLQRCSDYPRRLAATSRPSSAPSTSAPSTSAPSTSALSQPR